MDNADDRKYSDSKICAVCGDTALGNNFNAITCESCKAFFRRNALKNKELQCPFQQECTITPITRRFCQKCRLAKCYSVGMSSLLIMSEAEKERKRRKVIANKAKYRAVSSPPQECSSSQESNSSDYRSNNRLSSVETGVQTDLSCWCSSSRHRSAPHERSPSPRISSDVYCSPSISSSPSFLGGYTPMDATQKKLLNELVLASRALEAPVDQDVDLPCDQLKNASKSLLDVINLTALAIRRLIKMCKKMSGFKLLCQEDQVSILKQSCTQMMLLKSVSHFDPARDTWKIPHTPGKLSQIQVEVLKEAHGDIYEAHENFLRTFDLRAARDPNVMCILLAIALFDPSKQDIVDRPTVIRHQEMYYNLLQKYLDSAYHGKESLEIYQHLIMKMVELRHMNEDHIKVYLEVNPSQVEPILIEIFDLKPVKVERG
uniref:Nuclear hormone receptor HR96 n=1 Tax=Lygus hesperus TaxID=30085 RepID=A0A146KQD9_LYGHE